MIKKYNLTYLSSGSDVSVEKVLYEMEREKTANTHVNTEVYSGH